MSEYNFNTPCSLDLFVGREREINIFEEKINLLLTEGKITNLIIHGRSGIGKSSLFNKCIDIARKNRDVWVIDKPVPFKAETYFDELVPHLLAIHKGAYTPKAGKPGKFTPLMQRSYEIADTRALKRSKADLRAKSSEQISG